MLRRQLARRMYRRQLARRKPIDDRQKKLLKVKRYIDSGLYKTVFQRTFNPNLFINGFKYVQITNILLETPSVAKVVNYDGRTVLYHLLLRHGELTDLNRLQLSARAISIALDANPRAVAVKNCAEAPHDRDSDYPLHLALKHAHCGYIEEITIRIIDVTFNEMNNRRIRQADFFVGPHFEVDLMPPSVVAHLQQIFPENPIVPAIQQQDPIVQTLEPPVVASTATAQAVIPRPQAIVLADPPNQTTVTASPTLAATAAPTPSVAADSAVIPGSSSVPRKRQRKRI